MTTQADFVPGIWSLLSGSGGRVVLYSGKNATLSISADLHGFDLTVFDQNRIVEQASLAARPMAGAFKTVVVDAKSRKSSLTARSERECIALDYVFDGELILTLEEPYSIIAGSFAASQADQVTQPQVPIIASFLKAVNTDPSLRDQVFRVVASGIGPVTRTVAATDFCDFACKLCWASLGSNVHACIACIFCNGFAIAPPAHS